MCLYIRDRLLRLITDGSTLHAPLLSVLYLEATHRPFTPTLLSSFFSLLFPFAHPTPSRLFFFFFNDPPPPEISPLPLPDALPISRRPGHPASVGSPEPGAIGCALRGQVAGLRCSVHRIGTERRVRTCRPAGEGPVDERGVRYQIGRAHV